MRGQQQFFRHEVVDSAPPSERLGICLTTDLSGNGRDDVIVGGLGAPWRDRSIPTPIGPRLPNLDGIRDMVGVGEPNLYWYENPGWECHPIGDPPLDVGAALTDIDGDGRVDIVVGQGLGDHDVYWFEQPSDPRDRWTKHVITDAFEKYHDLAVGDVDDDGDQEIAGLSQESEVLFYYDVPADLSQSPWPDDHLHVIAEDFRAEGLQIVDIDGDGRSEIVAGTSIFERSSTDTWLQTTFASEDDWDDTRLAIADLDGDGEFEIVLSEGDSPYLGTHPARVAWFDPPEWTPTILRDDLFCPHSLQLADFTGNGFVDIFVAEMGLAENDDPKHILFVNQGSGEFVERVVETGVPTHQAQIADLTGDGRPDIVGKTYEVEGTDHVDAWYNQFGR